jgi:hypothetical protein
MATIRAQLNYLLPNWFNSRSFLRWPPDAFALCAFLLLKSGAYTTMLSDWPPSRGKDWCAYIEQVGRRWRESCYGGPFPPEILKWWEVVRKNSTRSTEEIPSSKLLVRALLQLLAAADEACAGVGIPSNTDEELDLFDYTAGLQLVMDESNSTLCKFVHGTEARVLPKMHTPQSGLTIRSLTHNICFVYGDEMKPIWSVVPFKKQERDLKLLLMPWPLKIRTDDFRPVPAAQSGMANLPRNFGMFAYRCADPRSKVGAILRIFDAALKTAKRIDAVVLPELALTEKECAELHQELYKRRSCLIAGVKERGTVAPRNSVHVAIPALGRDFSTRQAKHHRWKLDLRQVETYKLKKLARKDFWWEHVDIRDRAINFYAMKPWLTFSVLICEDLARPDPVGDTIRAVGPNLVIALLMDGPQLEERWPGRHAMALVEDPGCSVLTLTCVGMSELSRPNGKPTQYQRQIGLWRDPGSSRATAIKLPKSAASVLLDISIEQREEWTSDGRSDGTVTGRPVLRSLVFLGRNGNRVGGKSIS